MKKNHLILILFIFLIISNNINAQETNNFKWKNYIFKSTIKDEGILEWELKNNENKILIKNENDLTTGRFLDYKTKKIAGKDMLFITHHSGGEGIIQMSLLILTEEKPQKITMQVLEQIVVNWEIYDLNQDKMEDLILTDYQYFRLKLKDCLSDEFPDPHFEGSMMPTILKFDNKTNRFVEEKDEMFKEAMIRKYYTFLEKKPKKTNLDFIHLYYVAFATDKEKEVYQFFNKQKQMIELSCNQSNNKKIKMKLTDFFKKYGQEIMMGKN